MQTRPWLANGLERLALFRCYSKAACLRVMFIEHQVMYHGATKNPFGDEPRKRGSPYHPPFLDGNDTWRISGILHPGYHGYHVQRGLAGIPVQSVLPSSGHPGTLHNNISIIYNTVLVNSHETLSGSSEQLHDWKHGS